MLVLQAGQSANWSGGGGGALLRSFTCVAGDIKAGLGLCKSITPSSDYLYTIIQQ